MGQWCSSAGLDPEATLPLDQGRAPPAVPLLSGALAAPLEKVSDCRGAGG